MPFGAHETMEAHEILNEKLNVIQHLSLYAQMAQSQQLWEMIDRHLSTAVRGYDQLVAYTHDYNTAQQGQQAAPAFGVMDQVQPNDVQYGLRQPAPVAPALQGVLNDQQVLWAMLSCHKNSAKLHMQASLECADPNVRQMLMRDANICNEEAYEVFMVMNRQGQYQVPTMNDHTAKTFLHSYQSSGGQQNSPMAPGSMQ
jgi:spore coat protein CotF